MKIEKSMQCSKKIEGMKGYKNKDAPPKFTSKLFWLHFEKFKFLYIYFKQNNFIGNMNLIEV